MTLRRVRFEGGPLDGTSRDLLHGQEAYGWIWLEEDGLVRTRPVIKFLAVYQLAEPGEEPLYRPYEGPLHDIPHVVIKGSSTEG